MKVSHPRQRLMILWQTLDREFKRHGLRKIGAPYYSVESMNELIRQITAIDESMVQALRDWTDAHADHAIEPGWPFDYHPQVVALFRVARTYFGEDPDPKRRHLWEKFGIDGVRPLQEGDIPNWTAAYPVGTEVRLNWEDISRCYVVSTSAWMKDGRPVVGVTDVDGEKHVVSLDDIFRWVEGTRSGELR